MVFLKKNSSRTAEKVNILYFILICDILICLPLDVPIRKYLEKNFRVRLHLGLRIIYLYK